MKVVGILSSPRGKKSNTLKLMDAALEGAAEAEAEVEAIDIAKLKIKYCIACDSCHEKGECTIKDDFNLVMGKLLAADGIILSSPNYITNVTAQLKTLFDRSPLMVHEQLFEGKYGFSLTTAGSGEVDFVLDIMNNYMKTCGGNTIGGVGCAMSQGPSALETAIEKSREMGKDLVKAINDKRQYPEQEAAQKTWRERFKYVLLANKDRWTHNCDYWMEKGWIQK
ncbi:flavodoxin family protein [Methanosarcina sp.]|uniref:flavodoxin family protein n=1 Tax=Methanosarcina sp. TaxID=2213 RepID=UPI0029889E6F|nr:flavodoxin family protein [Methanosarcina sp.]MDW5549964.1 flavodoxin family protein [Methanosarcina sp.]MDW5552568.1 flavodoxin family protein [Methanosarcina sp.]MDW5560999.1 flavodoxin family protein [Methanosarcina sp.]